MPYVLALLNDSEASRIEDYMAEDHGGLDEPTARETVENNKAAWQKPEPLLAALKAFRDCLLHNSEVASGLSFTSHTIAEHLEATEELIKQVEYAQQQGATSVRLEADAFLL